MKTCTACRIEKSMEEFGNARRGAGGRKAECKSCDRLRQKNYYHKNANKFAAFNLRKVYGITLADYQSLFEKQNGKCAICERHQSELSKALNVDHCHKTGKIRGLLCGSCNRGLGLLKDSSGVLRKAADYLEVTTKTAA